MTTIQLHGFSLDLPEEHWLSQIRQELPDYSENIGRLAGAVERKYPGRGLIDIGANVGDTAAIVRGHSHLPVLCIEGSEFYFEILKENVRRLNSDIELECALVDSASLERSGHLSLEFGTATFHASAGNGASRRFARLDDILARHPRFLTSKILKIDTDGMDGRILEGAFEWIRAVRPVLFWEHDVGRDAGANGPGLGIFSRLVEAGYRSGLIFDNTGEFIQTISLEATQQLAEVSEYLPGGEQFYGYIDVCAFHDEDSDLCALVREIEIDSRRTRRKNNPKALNEPLFRALVRAQFDLHGARITNAVQEAVTGSGSPLVSEFQSLRALLQGERDRISQRGEIQSERAQLQSERSQIQSERAQIQSERTQAQFDRHRMQLRITDLETQVSSKDTEINKLHAMLLDLLTGEPLSRGSEAGGQRRLRWSTHLGSGEAQVEELMNQLANAQADCAALRQQLDSSLALKLARSLGWLLEPVRKLFGGNSRGGPS